MQFDLKIKGLFVCIFLTVAQWICNFEPVYIKLLPETLGEASFYLCTVQCKNFRQYKTVANHPFQRIW